MTEYALEDTIKVNNYLREEVKKNFPEYEVVEIDTIPHVGYLPELSIHKTIKDKIATQKENKDYNYIFINKNGIDILNKVVFSNNEYHLIYEPYGSRLSYFDSKFNFLGETEDLMGHNGFENAIRGKSFETVRSFDFTINFSTSQFKKIGLYINKEDENFFDVSAAGKNKVKTVKFDYKKKQIKASVVNCFIKNIIFDLEGNIQSIGIKNKLSKELTLTKTQYDVNSYSSLINLIELELDLYNLMTDKTLDIISQNIFDSQTNFVRNIIKEKENIPSKDIYYHIDRIKNIFNNTDITTRRMNMSVLTIENTEYDKYSNFRQLGLEYSDACQTLMFLSSLKIKKLDFNVFLHKDILESFKYLNKVSDDFKDVFKIEIENSKKNKIKNGN